MLLLVAVPYKPVALERKRGIQKQNIDIILST